MNPKFGHKWIDQVRDLRDNDEISDEEEGFMLGYDQAFD